jgi:hypothetical protein
MRFMGRSAAVVLVAALALAGCAAAPTSRDQPRSATESAPTADSAPVAAVSMGEAPDPLGLVNLWRVAGADGESGNTWLRIDAYDFQLWRDCGITSGTWRASGHMFAASTGAADAACAPTMDVPWLESIVSFRAVDGGWELTDSAGDVVAALTIDGAPEVIPTAAGFFTQPPVVTDATRETLRQPAPLAEGLVPATAEDLVGRWEPVGYDLTNIVEQPYVRFTTIGTWKAVDGVCGGGVGNWTADGYGAFIAPPSSFHSLVLCPNVPVSGSVEGTSLVALDGDVLRLLDIDGVELMELERV